MGKINNLNDLVKEIKNTKEVASLEEDHNPLTRRVRMGKIKKAKEKLDDLYIEYKDALREKATIILVNGSEAGKFEEVATNEFGCFSVSADSFYSELISDIHERLYTNYSSSPSLFNAINDKFEEISKRIGIVSFPMLMFESKFKKVLKDKNDLKQLITRAFNEKIGAESVGLYALSEISKKAAEEEFAGKTVPIVMKVDDNLLLKELQQDLGRLINNVFTVSAGESSDEIGNKSLVNLKEITTESVENSLLKIKEKL